MISTELLDNILMKYFEACCYNNIKWKLLEEVCILFQSIVFVIRTLKYVFT